MLDKMKNIFVRFAAVLLLISSSAFWLNWHNSSNAFFYFILLFLLIFFLLKKSWVPYVPAIILPALFSYYILPEINVLPGVRAIIASTFFGAFICLASIFTIPKKTQ